MYDDDIDWTSIWRSRCRKRYVVPVRRVVCARCCPGRGW